jgi:hypothetical protein
MMPSLSRLRSSERYSSSSGSRLSGPLLQSYHGSPRHSFRQQRQTPSAGAVLAQVTVVLLVLAGCFVGGKHYLYKRSLSSSEDSDFLSSLGLGSSSQERSSSSSSPSSSSFWPPSDLNLKLPRPSWGKTSEPDPEAAEAAAKALKGTRAGRCAQCAARPTGSGCGRVPQRACAACLCHSLSCSTSTECD